MIDDALYWALGIILYGDITLILIKLAVGGDAVTLKAVATGYGRAAALPVWAQVLVIFTITDLVQYWIHRLLHGRALWPFHAIHHSAGEVTWSTTYRIHPVKPG